MSEWKKIEPTTEGYNPTWDPQEENELMGTYVDKKEGIGANKSNLYTFRKKDGSLVSVWGCAVLDVRFGNLEAGEDVKIVYKGKVSNEKTGRTYHDFDVYHRESEIPVVEDNVEDGSDNPF